MGILKDASLTAIYGAQGEMCGSDNDEERYSGEVKVFLLMDYGCKVGHTKCLDMLNLRGFGGIMIFRLKF